MWLAIETSGETASVALGTPGRVAAERTLEGKRQHARELLPMIRGVLDDAGVGLPEVKGILLGDGPGSFTGLRIGAATAKALIRTHGAQLWTAPSLRLMAAGAVAAGQGRVLAVRDALRGDVYAALYRFPHGRVEVDVSPRTLAPGSLVGSFPEPDLIVGVLPDDLRSAFGAWSSEVPWEEGRPEAVTLLSLLARSEGLDRVEPESVAAWEPGYGRKAEAQAKWERIHGKPLPDQRSPAG